MQSCRETHKCKFLLGKQSITMLVKEGSDANTDWGWCIKYKSIWSEMLLFVKDFQHVTVGERCCNNLKSCCAVLIP